MNMEEESSLKLQFNPKQPGPADHTANPDFLADRGTKKEILPKMNLLGC